MNIKQIVEKVTNNWPIKIICFVLAIILYILHQASMIEKKTFIVPLTIINDGNYTYIGELEKKVSVIVKTSPEHMNSIQTDDITASINLNAKNPNSIYPVNITVDDSILKIDPLEIQVKPEHIHVNVEEKVMKYVKVIPSIVDEVASGYRIESINCDPPFVEIIGPKSVVEQVDEVNTKRIPSNVSECTIPAIGVRPPFFTFAAVLAIAPVAGIPPKRPEAIFPTPCPINSAFDLCLLPIIPSETTQESNDSIDAKIAMVNAGEINFCTSPKLILGREKVGNALLIT